MKKNKKVYIYGLCNVYYDSFYIQGLREIFHDIEFNISRFPNFVQVTFAVILLQNGFETKIIIDSRDTNEIDLLSFNWCNKYGKVNYNYATIPVDPLKKVIAVGPSFGIKIWSFSKKMYFALTNLIKYRSKISNNREFIANYWRQYKRMPIKLYHPKKSSYANVFFIGSIWKNEKITNNFRALFIESCLKNKEIKFIGGFAPRNDGNNLGLESLVYCKKIALKEYLPSIQNSAFAFNTPAVLSCHGWKLAEFLALGKAIISTEHKNVMPALLKDNVHLLYVADAEDIKMKIAILLSDSDLKSRLEKNSRSYFEEHLAPSVIVSKLL